MEKVKIEKPTEEVLKKLNVSSWPIWTKGISEFDWYYDETETCYILEGEVEVTLEDSKVYKISAGDMVTFQKGLECKWKILKPVRKHYNFNVYK